MRRAACKDWAEASCLISNLLAELEQPCRICREDSLVLTGRSPTGETVTVDEGYVRLRLEGLAKDSDLSKFIL